ncbi:hypothetical protein ARMSODRAFT_1027368 [Armillaria solidipes]|uniref:Uncharacterized protein n=1 Tax=Armillaria solidipes TaxID=1076256 RepID=A0A2H3B0J0_9AGAR|nr:hypothetical protein ARMSODRAFT_1027368 [Armillaria solidipes]
MKRLPGLPVGIDAGDTALGGYGQTSLTYQNGDRGYGNFPQFFLPTMAWPTKYTTEEAKRQSNREKSSRSYMKNQEAIQERRQKKYQEAQSKRNHRTRRIGGTNALELVQTPRPSSSTPATSAEQPSSQCREVVRLAVRAKRIQHDFEEFTCGLDAVKYAESLIQAYFAEGDGKINVFTDPLEHTYEFQRLYDDVLKDLLQAEGCTPRRDAVEKAGQPIKDVISFLEDIWCVAIEGRTELCLAYKRGRLIWQR